MQIDLGEWRNHQQWPVCDCFVAGEINNEVYLWGGLQQVSDLFNPFNVVYNFNPEKQSWRQLPVSGDSSPLSMHCAGVVCSDLLYIFGGTMGDSRSNNIHVFSPSSCDFKLLPAVGARPLPRCGHEGWTHEGKLFFLGGLVGTTDPWSLLTSNVENDGVFDESLYQFDPENNVWTRLTTLGASPPPRYFFAVAKIEDQVFIHGGLGTLQRYSIACWLDITLQRYCKTL